MSEPPDNGPLPKIADIPLAHLSRPGKRVQHNIVFDFQEPGESSTDGAGGRIPRPAAAVTTGPTSGHSLSKLPEFDLDNNGGGLDPDPKINYKTNPPSGANEHQFLSNSDAGSLKNPYTPSAWSKLILFLKTLPYATKVALYRGLLFTWHLPEHIARSWMRFWFAPLRAANLPTPTIANASSGQGSKSGDVISRFFKTLFTKEALQIHGCFLTLTMNGAFAYWVYVHSQVYLDPHTWRQRKYVTSSSGTFNTFTSLEIWIAIMLALWNLGGSYLIVVGFISILGAFFKYTGLLKLGAWWRNRRGPQRRNFRTTSWARSQTTANKPSPAFAFWFLLYLACMALWPIMGSTIPAPQLRKSQYGRRCKGWDFRVKLDGRVDAANLTRGTVTMYDQENGGRQVVFLTKDFVNTTWARTEENVLLRRVTDPPGGGEVYVSEVAFRFPYMWTAYENKGWASLGDVRRDQGGNYTAMLINPADNTTRTVEGGFPYLNDEDRGLRLEQLGLIPDVRRSWRTLAARSENCPWGPDAKLLESTDGMSRTVVGEGRALIQTDMTKFGRCSELTVCANRRKEGLLYGFEGDEGRKALDEMLVVPLGLLLVEQIRWASCCGDGWEPYKVPPPTT